MYFHLVSHMPVLRVAILNLFLNLFGTYFCKKNYLADVTAVQSLYLNCMLAGSHWCIQDIDYIGKETKKCKTI